MAPRTQGAAPLRTGDDVVSGILHGAGVLLSVAALTLLVVLAARSDGPRLASAVVFGVGLLLLYAASTLYHLAPGPRLRRAFKIVDHACIYVLIAATYTPFALVTLRGAAGWWLFGVIWALALAGVVVEAAWLHRPRWLSAAVYLLMGWLIVFAREPLLERLPAGGLALLVAGGLVYSAGTLFYVMHRVPYMHSVWHVFVLGGSTCHVLAVAVYVL